MKTLHKIVEGWRWHRMMFSAYPSWAAFNAALETEKRTSYLKGFEDAQKLILDELLRNPGTFVCKGNGMVC